jgi:hypothetical protein
MTKILGVALDWSTPPEPPMQPPRTAPKPAKPPSQAPLKPAESAPDHTGSSLPQYPPVGLWSRLQGPF